METAASLRGHTARCVKFAESTTDPALEKQLLAIAADLLAEADRMDGADGLGQSRSARGS
jgi:hypothetical protein